MRALIAILTVLMVLGGLAFWLFLGEEGEGGFEAGRIEAGIEDEVSTEARRSRSLAEDDASREVSFEDDAVEEAALEAAVPITGGQLFRCVLKENGEPVPGAEVFLREGHSGSDPRVAPGMPTVAEFREFGTRYRADREGRVWLPPRSGFLRAIALAEGLFGGVTNFRIGESEELVLEMVATRAVVVEVVGGDGNPRPGIEVALRRLYGSRDNVSTGEVVATDEAGRAALDLSPTLAAGYTSGFELMVGIVGSFEEPVEKPIDPYELPEGPIRLVLPPCGAIRVRAEPGPPDPGAWVYLLDPDRRGRYRRQRFAGDEVLFRTIGLGLDLRLSYQPAESSSDARQAREIAGPGSAGEIVEVVLDRDAEPKRPVLAATLVDPEGRALAGKDVAIRRFEGAASVAEWNVMGARTDGSGRLVLGLDETAARDLARSPWALVVQFEPGRPLVRMFPAQAFPLGMTDLDRIEMADLPLVVAGRVLNDAGEPIRGARISVENKRTDRSRGRQLDYGGLSAVSDVEGRFAMHDVFERDRVNLRAWKSDHVTGMVECVKGSRDVVLELGRRARVRLRCIAADGSVITGLRFEYLRDGDESRRQSAPVPEDGNLDIVVESDRYDMRLVRAGTFMARNGERLADWPGLDVPPGELRDLGEVVVPARGINVEVAIRMREESSPGHFQYRVFEPGTTRAIRTGYQPGSAGRVIRFNVDHLPVDLEVTAEGAGVARATIREAKASITIGPGIRVGIRFRCDDPSLGGKMVFCHLTGQGGYYSAGVAWMGADTTWFVLPEPGRYAVMPNVEGKQLPRKTGDGVALFAPDSIELKPDADEPVFTITFSRDLAGHLD